MKKILLVGNCNLDGPRITEMIESNLKAKVVEAKEMDRAKEILTNSSKSFNLILVNRIGAFDNKNGLELIDHVKKTNIKTPIMLITNYPDKMKEAIKHGAVKGFGKNEIESKETIDLIKKYL